MRKMGTARRERKVEGMLNFSQKKTNIFVCNVVLAWYGLQMSQFTIISLYLD